MDVTMSRTREPARSRTKEKADRVQETAVDQRIRVVEDFTELSANERLVWNALAAQQAVTVPFQSLFWNETWWKHFGDTSQFGDKRLQIFVVHHGSEIIAFFPMLRQRCSWAGIQMLRYIQPLGGDGNLTELRTGIVKQGFERAAYSALLDYFNNVDREWEVISLPAGPPQVAGQYEAISVAHPTIPVIEGFSIPLAADWDSFRSGLKRNIKESIRKCHNSFKRAGIEPQFSCLSDPDSIREALPEFYRLHSLRSEQEGGNDHRDAFEAEHAREFVNLLADDAPASGFRLFQLKDGDRLIAARLGFDTENGTYLYYSGYDLDYGRYSVMTRLVIEVIKRAIASGKECVHMSFGRDVSKTRWSPQETPYKWHLMFQQSLRGRLAALALTSLMRLKSR